MEKLDLLAKQWEETEEEFSRLKDKRDELERNIYSQMIENIWRDYNTPDNIHISIIHKEIKDIDWIGLSILLKESEIKNITKYSVEKKLVIVTNKGRERIRKIIKEGR